MDCKIETFSSAATVAAQVSESSTPFSPLRDHALNCFLCCITQLPNFQPVGPRAGHSPLIDSSPRRDLFQIAPWVAPRFSLYPKRRIFASPRRGSLTCRAECSSRVG